MKPKEFLKKWGEGIKNCSPTQQLQARLIGTRGAIIGLILATVVMMYRGMWYFGVFMFFIIFLQVVQLIGIRQQYEATKKITQEINNIDQDLNDKKIDMELGNQIG